MPDRTGRDARAPRASFLRELLASADAPTSGSLDAFIEALRAMTASSPPFEIACAGGFHADRMGFAFVAGYQGALCALVPELDRARSYALCATEAGGVHPKAIRTTLLRDDAGRLRLRGEKTFVTLGERADELLVVASSGTTEDGKSALAIARVDARAEGVRLSKLREMPFCPEVGHARLVLDGVAVRDEDVLPGDGYSRYLKPFRTVEDVHVHAALVAYVLGASARFSFPIALREGLAAIVASLATLAASDPSAPETHVALAGTIALARRLLDDADPCFAATDPETAMRWKRDRPLLAVAEKARTARITSAWRSFGIKPPE